MEGVKMKKDSPLYVSSEIGRLKKVLLHRPGKEIERLTPALLERLLFEDIPFLDIAVKEHDEFANTLKKNGVEVYYLDEMVAVAINNPEIKDKFINQFLDEGKVCSEKNRYALKKYFSDLNNISLIRTMMDGIKKRDVAGLEIYSLKNMVERDYPFILDPMPNLYFTRDPFATIGTGITLNHMKTETRNRETIFAEYIFKYHPEFAEKDIPMFYNRYEKTSLEGGDELVLSKKVLAIGISQRTDPASIEKVAKKIFSCKQTFDIILAFLIPAKRAFMHLDTVFTMVDYNKFTIHAEIEGPLRVFSLTAGVNNDVNIKEENATLEEILKYYLKLDDITLIRCAGGDPIDAGREQWNDGSNTLAIAPGEVIVYSRNYVTNNILSEHGVKVHPIPSSELSRGRGGPRCMSMPLFREDI